MATDVIMPALGVAQDTGKVLRWLRSEGEQVEKGAPIMEIETDKVTVEVEAPASGTLAGIRFSEGADVPVGDVVALILAAGEETPPEAPVAVSDGAAATPSGSEPQGRGNGAAPAEARPVRRPLASPKARRIAKERGIDVASLSGSGPATPRTSTSSTRSTATGRATTARLPSAPPRGRSSTRTSAAATFSTTRSR